MKRKTNVLLTGKGGVGVGVACEGVERGGAVLVGCEPGGGVSGGLAVALCL